MKLGDWYYKGEIADFQENLCPFKITVHHFK